MRSRCESLRHRCGRNGSGGILRPARQEYAKGRGGATRSIPSSSFNWCRFGLLLPQRLFSRSIGRASFRLRFFLYVSFSFVSLSFHFTFFLFFFFLFFFFFFF